MRKVRKSGKLVYGVGINDADYSVTRRAIVGGLEKVVWMCPFYQTWSSMLERCYSKKLHQKRPTYVGCHTIPEWHYFMTFRAWMEKQDWKDKELDKDLLLPGNKMYGPDTCVFIDSLLNKFLIESTASRGIYPIGVSLHTQTGKFRSRCSDFLIGDSVWLGLHETPEQAHEAWRIEKLRQATVLASSQTDERIAKALIERYQNYK